MAKSSYTGPLTAHVGFWLRFVSNHVSHAFSQKLAKHEVSVAEWAVMRELSDQEAIIPSELAIRLGLTRGAISKLADRLVARGLITRTEGADDRRYQPLVLTRAGRALVPVLTALADRNDEEFFGHLPPATRDMLASTMQAIVSHHDLRTIPVA